MSENAKYQGRLVDTPPNRTFDGPEAKRLLTAELQSLKNQCHLKLLEIAQLNGQGYQSQDLRESEYTFKFTQEIFIPMLQKLINESDECQILTL